MKLFSRHKLYMGVISAIGAFLIAQAVWELPQVSDPVNLLLVVVLAALAQITTARTGRVMAYEVGTAVSVAVIPVFGPLAAVLAGAGASISTWLILHSRRNAPQSRKLQLLLFNMGVFTISIYFASQVFLFLNQFLSEIRWAKTILPWLATAVVYDQLNLWLVIIIMRLEQGKQANPWEIWRQNRWATIINVGLLSIGGGVLAFAFQQFGQIGILIFYLPILLSAFAFHLYTRQMQEHMNNLENIIAERTQALQQLMKEKDQFLAVLTHDMKTPLRRGNFTKSTSPCGNCEQYFRLGKASN